MVSDEVILEWKSYSPIVSKGFQSLYNDRHFTDVTLACDDNMQVFAHKVVLQTCSDFFKTILLANPNPHPLLYLQGTSFSDIQLLKQCMYLGKCLLKKEKFNDFLNTSAKFLNKQCSSEMK